MKSILNMVLLLIIGFGTAATGIEVYKYHQVVSVFEDEVGNLAMDALELAADDGYRMEHVLWVDETVAKSSFMVLLTNRYQLSETLRPLHRHDSIRQIHLQKVNVTGGVFYEENGLMVQTAMPAFYVEGTLEMKPLVLGVDKTVLVPFKVLARMKRVP